MSAGIKEEDFDLQEDHELDELDSDDNFQELNKEEMVMAIEKLNESPIQQLNFTNFGKLREAFEDSLKFENSVKLKEFIDNGGNSFDFKVSADELEIRFRNAVNSIKNKRESLLKEQDRQKEENLKGKNEILEEMRKLTESEGKIPNLYAKFQELQNKWKSIGPLPGKQEKEYWLVYHHHSEKFYSYLKISKELRELNLKKNYESKEELCEKAQELLKEKSLNNALAKFTVLYNEWRQIGPVHNDDREKIWQRFIAVKEVLNTQKKEHLKILRGKQEENLKVKVDLCEKAEKLGEQTFSKFKDWQKATKEVIELQADWKKTGYAPKEVNEKIWKRFRAACDKFFDGKKDFFKQSKSELEANKTKKNELCAKAEALSESQDWVKTTSALIRLQNDWKKIGPVGSHSLSDQIWNRFRKACDTFFENKAKQVAEAEAALVGNEELKKDLIQRIVDCKPEGKPKEVKKVLSAFRHEWKEIGEVPSAARSEIQKKYNAAIKTMVNAMEMTDLQKSRILYQGEIDQMLQGKNPKEQIEHQQRHFTKQIKQEENEIITLENNLEFFRHSKNADHIREEVNAKVSTAREKLDILKEKLEMLKAVKF